MGLIFIGEENGDCDLTDLFERSGTRTYLAAYDYTDDEVFARNNCGIVINDPHPTDTGSVVVRIRASYKDTTAVPYQNPNDLADISDSPPLVRWFIIEVTYGPWNPLEHTITGNPVDQPIDFSFQWQVFEQYVDVAIDPGTGNLVNVCNSAGDPYDPPVTREQLKGVMRVAWNSLTFDPVSFFTYGNYINSQPWNGFPTHTVKFSPPNMPQRLYSQFLQRTYYRLEGEFCFNPNDGGWDAMPIDRGFRFLQGGVPVKIFDVNCQPISQPALLDGSGGVQANPTTASVQQKTYQIYNDIDFNSVFSNLNNLFN